MEELLLVIGEVMDFEGEEPTLLVSDTWAIGSETTAVLLHLSSSKRKLTVYYACAAHDELTAISIAALSAAAVRN